MLMVLTFQGHLARGLSLKCIDFTYMHGILWIFAKKVPLAHPGVKLVTLVLLVERELTNRATILASAPLTQ